MTQRERALDALVRINDAIAGVAAPLQSALRDLRTVLGHAQNAPPLGVADGSIDEELWTKLRDHADNLERAIWSLTER